MGGPTVKVEIGDELGSAVVLERGAMPTIWSDPINRLQSLYAIQLTNTVTLSADTVKDLNAVSLVAGHGFVAGDTIVISDISNATDPHLFVAEVLVSAATSVNIDAPLDHVYPAASFAFRGTNEMNVVGVAGSTKVFSVQPPVGYDWDMTRMLVSMVTVGTPDDGKFGDIEGGLTNGLVVRLCRNYDAECYNLATWRTNADIANYCYDMTYSARSVPQGAYGIRARWTFAGPSKMGATARLRGGDSVQAGSQDRLEFIIQDDLTDLTSFRVLMQGHWVNLVWNGS